jgi:ElaB/YqjD/DUF883 family membrane-anchored ribosome-binding protein
MAKTTTATVKTTAKKPAAAKKAPAKKAASTAKPATSDTKAKITKAVESARANATALTKEAQVKANEYKQQLAERSEDWAGEAKELASQAKDRAADLAVEGKAKASDAIASLGQIVADNAGTIDEKLGARYGDYARTAARSMQETAAKIEAKDLNELGDDAKQFVRKSPGLAIGLAAFAGFLFSRLFKGNSSRD